MSRELLKKKYGMSLRQPAPEAIPPEPDHRPWHDSAPVTRLMMYLEEHNDQGIQLSLEDGAPAIRFRPGLSRNDGPGRWQICNDAVLLYREALEDLRKLARPGGFVPATTPAGPSREMNPQGSRQLAFSLLLGI